MTRIPFIDTQFPKRPMSRMAMEHHLLNHLRAVRAAKKPDPLPNKDAGGPDEWPDTPMHAAKDDANIRRRAARLYEKREAASGLSHLKTDERERLGVLRDGVRFVCIATEHRADEIAAELHAEMPWMAPATEVVWQAMRRSAHRGEAGLRLPSLLLDGPPGIGKSVWARWLGEMIGTPRVVIEATGESAGFGIVGLQRGWSNAAPGRLVETVLATLVGNPLVIVDEVEKAGHVASSKGQSFGLADALLPLLERATAQGWACPFYRVRFDMSWIGWVLTSNRKALLPEPFLSRCRVIALHPLERSDLVAFSQREGKRRALSETSLDAIATALNHPDTQHRQMSLRSVIRLLENAEVLESRPMSV